MNCTKERPILFSGEMVRAILGGRKTQTRRVAKLDPRMMEGEAAVWCPHGKPGDRLWVKETWAPVEPAFTKKPICEIEGVRLLYRADDEAAHIEGPWKPSIFMPRWASRITLEITAVRVERLQDISEEDANAEGCTETWEKAEDVPSGKTVMVHKTAIHHYSILWHSINAAKHPWASNPWVWVVSFKPIGHYLEALRRATA